MNNRQVIQWITAAAGRGIAWFLAVRLGLDAAQSGQLGTSIAQAVAALVLAGISIYSSVKGRRRLLAASPPED